MGQTGPLLLDALGTEAVRDTVLSWLALVRRPRTLPLERLEWEPDINNAYDPYNATALRGLDWLLSLLPPRPDVARARVSRRGLVIGAVP